ncbi:Ryanodine receptor Ryr [Maribellus sp. CM-23]|uniref:RyR domain-containing protein n=1 Tax=Maribellus sp. CM-23 TaxID=2781026 RepID=UPI001EEDCC60|nr:RyR domain-containing protein [Maribellus sp. CM-23]MCE4566923.1 Ryanodine receptor Ryr [Maribellus sp. CM-23]
MDEETNIPVSLQKLIEELAENVHETWMEARIKEGWVWGEKRNEDKKTHPCIIPYEQLPEFEKDYDRKTAIETIKFIINAGYQINKINI